MSYICLTIFDILLARFIFGDDLHAPGLRIGRKENLVQPGITLVLIHIIDKLVHCNGVSLCATKNFHINLNECMKIKK